MRVEGIQRRLLDDARDVFNAGLAVNGLVVGAHGHGGASRRAGMRVEHHGVAGGDDVDDVAAQRGNRMRAGRDRANDAERRVFLQRDAVIAAAPVRPQPVHAGNELDDLQLLDLVVEPADLGFVEFDPAPRLGVFLGQGLDDSSILRRRPCLLPIFKNRCGRRAGFVGILEHTKFPGTAPAGGFWQSQAVSATGVGGAGAHATGEPRRPALPRPHHGLKFHSRRSYSVLNDVSVLSGTMQQGFNAKTP